MKCRTELRQEKGYKEKEKFKSQGLQTLEEMDVTARMVAVNARGNEKQRWKTLDTPTAQH